MEVASSDDAALASVLEAFGRGLARLFLLCHLGKEVPPQTHFTASEKTH